jgi:hypothetical protein
MSPAWDGDGLNNLWGDAHEILEKHRWDLIDRAVNLRQHGYWRQEVCPPKSYENMSAEEFHERGARWLAWHREQRAKLAYIKIQFEAQPRISSS